MQKASKFDEAEMQRFSATYWGKTFLGGMNMKFDEVIVRHLLMKVFVASSVNDRQ